MKKSIIVIGLMILSTHVLQAQGGDLENEALRYAQTNISGSSRTQALAGAGVALGADISSANINPAGLGLLRKGELSFSVSMGVAKTTSKFLKSTTRDFKLFAGVPNFGIVFTKLKDVSDNSAYRGGSFAITFTKITNFQNQFSYNGINANNSIADFFVKDANGFTENSLRKELVNNEVLSFAGAAYNSGIIDPIYKIVNKDTLPRSGTSTEYQTRFPVAEQRQRETVRSRAGQYSWDFSYGGNIKDKFYFGFGLGLLKTNYSYVRTFNEDPITEFDNDLTNIYIKDTYSASGFGVNLKGGIIFKPLDAIRIGISGQTPTIYSIDETFNTNFNSEIDGEKFPLTFAPGLSNYSLLSPAKINSGVAFIIGKHGFLTGEVSYLSYSAAEFLNSPDDNAYSKANDAVQSNFGSALNFKGAGELRISQFRMRAGLAYYGDPYKNSFDENRDVIALTTGIGFRFENQYLDFALINSKYNSIYQPYTLLNGEQPTAVTRNSLTTLNFTYGAYF